MSFDMEKFKNTNFTPREAGIEVPALSGFFPEGEKPVWRVRGLTADEVARCNEAASKNKTVEAIAEALATGGKQDQVEAIRKVLGVSTSVHSEIAKRMEQLVLGSIDPVVSLDMVVKLATILPVEFYQLTNEILKLTGLGHVPGFPQGSGEGKTSEPV